MPYKKSYMKSSARKRYSRKRRRVGSQSTARIARKALAMTTTLTKSRELKHYDVNPAGFYPGQNLTDAAFYPLLNISQGTTDRTRVGDSIFARTLHLCGSITLPDQLNVVLPSIHNRQNFIRIWVAVWPAPAVLTTDLQNLFAYNNTSWVASLSFKAWDDRFRASILFNKIYAIHTYKPIINFDIKVKLRKLCQYDNSGVVRYNQIVYGFQSENTTGIVGGTFAYVNHMARITFNDS